EGGVGWSGGAKKKRKTAKGSKNISMSDTGDAQGPVLDDLGVTDSMVDQAVALRDKLMEVLQAMLSIHLVEDDDDGRNNVPTLIPRDYTEDQEELLVTPVRLKGWLISNEVAGLLKAFLTGVKGPAQRLPWKPDPSFTARLQEHFEAQEESMLQGALDDEAIMTAKVPNLKRQKRGGKGHSLATQGRVMVEGEVEGGAEDQERGDDRDGLEDARTKVRGREREAQANKLLLPLMKSIYSNADRLNRRQAAAVVGHMAHSTPEASALARCFVGKLKEYNPIRCLEVHMATLRVFYDKWVVSPAAAVVDGDGGDSDPEEEEERRADAEAKGLSRWVQLAQKLSLSLGVGPVAPKSSRAGTDKDKAKTDMQEAFLRFMKEGVRFSLEREEAPDRFLFLECLPPYTNKLTQRQRKALASFFDDQASCLYANVAEEGRDYASSFDNGEVEGVPFRWMAFFSFRNHLSAGGKKLNALSTLPEAGLGSGLDLGLGSAASVNAYDGDDDDGYDGHGSDAGTASTEGTASR
ncbi:unnamed protein product, partial [Discosporangium mesarthrocarpum]